jgi:hypothetical protein
MSGLTELFSGFGWFLFGLAAVLVAVFLLRLLRRLDRIIALAEIGAVDQLPAIVRKLLGK